MKLQRWVLSAMFTLATGCSMQGTPSDEGLIGDNLSGRDLDQNGDVGIESQAQSEAQFALRLARRFDVTVSCSGFEECDAETGATSGNAHYAMVIQEGQCGAILPQAPVKAGEGNLVCDETTCTAAQDKAAWYSTSVFRPRVKQYAALTFIAFDGTITLGPNMISDLVCCTNYTGEEIAASYTSLDPVGPQPGSNLPPGEGCVVNLNQ